MMFKSGDRVELIQTNPFTIDKGLSAGSKGTVIGRAGDEVAVSWDKFPHRSIAHYGPIYDMRLLPVEAVPVEAVPPKQSGLKNLGKDAPMVTNEHGGKQSKTEYAFTQIDPGVLFELAEVLQHGAEKYGRDNWRKITVDEHMNHSLQHIYAYLIGNTEDDHLAHALCRLMFAMVVDRDGLDV